MTDTYEASNYDGAPVTLYEFSRGTQVWRYTDSDQDAYRDQDFGSQILPDVRHLLYEAYPIKNAGVVQSSEPSLDDVTITVPWDCPVVGLFLGTPPSSAVYIKIFRRQVGDSASDLAGGCPLVWIGTVGQSARTDAATAQLVCNTLVRSFEQNGLRLGWARTCPYVLYDPKTCKADKNAHATSGEVISVNGITVNVAEFATRPDNYFRGGFVEWLVADATYERRFIQQHSGTGITLFGAADGISVGLAVTAYRGCDRLIQTCHDEFDNVDNNGSVPTMPGVSPFDGNAVF